MTIVKANGLEWQLPGLLWQWQNNWVEDGTEFEDAGVLLDAIELKLKMADVIETYVFMQTFSGFNLSTHRKNFSIGHICSTDSRCYFRQLSRHKVYGRKDQTNSKPAIGSNTFKSVQSWERKTRKVWKCMSKNSICVSKVLFPK